MEKSNDLKDLISKYLHKAFNNFQSEILCQKKKKEKNLNFEMIEERYG